MQCACVQACEDDNHRKLGSIPHHHPKWAQSPSKRQRESFYVRYDTDRTLNGEVFHSRNDSSWAALRRDCANDRFSQRQRAVGAAAVFRLGGGQSYKVRSWYQSAL
jgi:hypothetical protein